MDEEEKKKKRKKYRNLIYATAAFLLAGIGILIYWFVWGQYTVSTDDAYVHGNMVELTPQIAGIVTSVNCEETQYVEEGQVLIVLDKNDKQIAFEESLSVLGQTVRDVTKMFERVYQLQAQLEEAQAHCLKMKTNYFDRRNLIDTGSISREDFIHSELDYLKAKAQVKSTKFQIKESLALVANTTIETHPYVIKTKEQVKKTYIDLRRCELLAPVNGIIAKRKAQVGESVNPQDPLLAIIPLDQIWVEANYKEDRLKNVKIGQLTHVTSDMYGHSVVYHGKVMGIYAGTGAVFSVLPPENATGNWIKIVQRLPVRLSVDPQVLKKYPLRLGLSIHAHIDIRDKDGPYVPPNEPTYPIYKTKVVEEQILGVDEIINEVIEDNLTFSCDIPSEFFSYLEDDD